MITLPGEIPGPGSLGMNDDRDWFGIDNADLRQVPVGPRADGHREAFFELKGADRVAQGVKHVRVGEPVLPRTACSRSSPEKALLD